MSTMNRTFILTSAPRFSQETADAFNRELTRHFEQAHGVKSVVGYKKCGPFLGHTAFPTGRTLYTITVYGFDGRNGRVKLADEDKRTQLQADEAIDVNNFIAELTSWQESE